MGQWLTVITISIIVSTINIVHVIIGLAKTPAGFTYLATGHYYLDYFIYLQAIAQGMAGNWLPWNYYSSGDIFVDQRFFPYILMGKIAKLSALSPMTIYWLSTFILTVLILIGFYYLIELMLKKEKFYLKITAFIISIFSGPFFKILINPNQVSIIAYDFWYGPASFFRRFGLVPYHSLAVLLSVIVIILLSRNWNIKLSLVIAVLLIIIMTFSPFVVLSIMPAVTIISGIYFLKKKKSRLKTVLFNSILLLTTICYGLMLKKIPSYNLISRFETQWVEHVSWWFILLNLGPMIITFPFGLKNYFISNNFTRLFLMIFTLISYGLFFSPAAYFIGTHNLRFFSSTSYVFFGVLTVIGLKKIAGFFKQAKTLVFLILTSLLMIYYFIFNFDSLQKRIKGQDIRIPEIKLTYVPTLLINHLKDLQNYPKNTVVLTDPQGEVGLLVPIFSYLPVYVGHANATLNYNQHYNLADNFYNGKMTNDQAKIFIKTNRINLVLLSIYEADKYKNIVKYSFLKPVFSDQIIRIWEVKP